MLALVTGALLELAGCGGDDGGDAPQPQKPTEQSIRDVIAAFYANKAGVCDLLTDRLVEKQFVSSDECEKQAEAVRPERDYTIREMSIDGSKAHVELKADSGPSVLILEQAGGQWKIADVRDCTAERPRPRAVPPGPRDAAGFDRDLQDRRRDAGLPGVAAGAARAAGASCDSRPYDRRRRRAAAEHADARTARATTAAPPGTAVAAVAAAAASADLAAAVTAADTA